MKHNGERRPEEIQAEIQRTRSNMDATLSAIENRLTPGQLRLVLFVFILLTSARVWWDVLLAR